MNKLGSENVGARGRGRPKGSVELGGASRLIAWAQEDPANERAFWATIYPKLLPLQVNGAGENGEHLVTFKTVYE
jgi:hypothetical protein